MDHRSRPALVLAIAAVASLVAQGRAHAQSPAPKPSPRAASPAPAASPVPSPSPSPAVAAARVIEGTVVGPDARPVAGALVSVQVAAVMNFGELTMTARTDAAGHFRVPVKSVATHILRVDAPGLAARTLPRVRPGDPLRIALEKGGSIEGIVRDGATGAPAPAATVEARLEGARGMGIVWERGAGVVRTRTDAQGRFRLEGLAAGLHTLAARAPGLTGLRRGVAVGKRTELYLFPGGGLDGSVRGPDGAAIAGAGVAVESAIPFGPRSTTDVEVTDARGHYAFVGLEAGLYRIIARHPDFAPSWTTVTVERGDDASADLTLAAPAAIVGRLLGAAERPVAGRVTIAEADGIAPPVSIAPTLAADAGADGRFRLDGVPPGSYVLSATAPGYGARRAEIVVGGRQRVADLGDVALESGLIIRGHVREAAGTPVAEARVSAFRDRSMGEDRGEGRTSADGTFAVGGLRAGTYRLTVFAPGHAMVDREVEAGTDGVEFVLETAGSLTGAVVDDRGQPVETFRVQARMPPPAPSAAGGRVMMGPPRFESVSSPDGRFVVDDVAPGTYVVEISAPERATATVASVKVSPGAATDVGRVVLGAGGIVRGSVVDAAGAPVPAAVVTVQGIGRTFAFGPTAAAEAVTDAGGTFEMRGVASGPIQVTARHPSFAEGRASAEVDPAKDPPEVRIALLQGGRIEGRARRRDGTGVAGAVNVFSRRSGASFSPNSLTPIAPDGSFVVEHVAAGTVNVVLMEGSGGQLTSSKEREVELIEGQTATVEFVPRDILVTGRVTRAGTAAGNLRLRVFGDHFNAMMMVGGATPPAASGPQRMTAVTREDGSYEMLVDEPGKGTIRVETVDGTVSYPTQRVEFPDADTFAFDIALPAAVVAGLVVDRETDQPLPKANIFAMSARPDPDSRFGTAAVSNAISAADGRFRLEVEPGEYKVSARAEGFSSETITVTVAESGSSEVRLALSRGLSIRGRVVDARGQGLGGLRVGAVTGEVENPRWGGMAISMPDGAYEIQGLTAGDVTLIASSELGFFALRPGVAAGTSDVTLTLRRGGRVVVSAVGPDGQPVRGAFASVRRVSGTVAWGIGAMMETDARGNTELSVPVGSVELRVTKEGGLEGFATIAVSEGATIPVEVTLSARKETSPSH
jgi:large repetitive protein